MIITIKQLERNTEDDVIITAHWSALLEESHTEPPHTTAEGIEVPETVVVDYTASSYGSQSFTRDDTSPDFIAFDDLTEADVIGWLTLDEGLEANLQAQIDEQKTPTTVSGKPWQEEVTEAV